MPANSGAPIAGRQGGVTSPWTAPADPLLEGPTRPPRRDVPWVLVLGVVAAVVLVVAVVLVARRSGGSSGHAAATTLPPPSTLPGTPLPGGGVPGNGSGAVSPDQDVLRQLGVQQSDVPRGYTVTLERNGDQVVGQATLDVCNGVFPSETRRAARRQVIVAGPDQTGVLSTEAVFYDDAGGTAQAFTDLRAVAAKCPRAPVVSPNGGGAATTTFNPTPDGSWPQTPGVERLAYDFTTVEPDGSSTRTVAVFLRRGRVLVGVYFPAPGEVVAVDGKTAIPDVVSIFARRLAKLPATIVTGHEPPAATPGAV